MTRTRGRRQGCRGGDSLSPGVLSFSGVLSPQMTVIDIGV